ncbi:DUF6011 domain-containing protein [Sporosarcina sp. FSL K6-1522]|uniref:DUF6011 domain-containing protein n=1 Tax=Sporosarcina sp. FSL K6-1522 TaxID=2921554 RepID=UPI003159EA5B
MTCGRCGRKLKTQKSIDDGYGPVCKVKQAIEDAEFERIQITLEEVVESEVAV